MPKVSVLITVFNKTIPRYLEESLESILRQTYTDYEVILVVDGPVPVEVQYVIEFYKIAFAKMEVIQLKSNVGLQKALNIGLKNANGEFIARMDDDDVAVHDRLECQTKILHTRSDLSIVGTNCYEIDHTGEILNEKLMPKTFQQVLKFSLLRDPVVHPSVMFRKKQVLDLGGYSEDNIYLGLEDTDLWQRAILNGLLIENFNVPLLKFRRSENFFEKRRGIYYGLREFVVRCKYVYERGKLHYVLLLFVLLIVRCSPKAILRLAYELRNKIFMRILS